MLTENPILDNVSALCLYCMNLLQQKSYGQKVENLQNFGAHSSENQVLEFTMY